MSSPFFIPPAYSSSFYRNRLRGTALVHLLNSCQAEEGWRQKSPRSACPRPALAHGDVPRGATRARSERPCRLGRARAGTMSERVVEERSAQKNPFSSGRPHLAPSCFRPGRSAQLRLRQRGSPAPRDKAQNVPGTTVRVAAARRPATPFEQWRAPRRGLPSSPTTGSEGSNPPHEGAPQRQRRRPTGLAVAASGSVDARRPSPSVLWAFWCCWRRRAALCCFVFRFSFSRRPRCCGRFL